MRTAPLLTAKDEDLLEDLLITVRGKLARASTASSVSVEAFSQVFVERMTASVVVALHLPMGNVLQGVQHEIMNLRGCEESDD